ncbi:MAG: putative bifunctional diguanylate cyclase/phosphodiesterase [Janthinobacterium lividum]
MRRHTHYLSMLIGGQLAFLVVGLGCEIWEVRLRPPTTLEDSVLASIIGHALLLVILTWYLATARRQHDAHAAILNKQLNRALKKAEDLIECSSDMVWEIDAFNRFTFVSDHNGVMNESWGLRVGMLVTELADLDPVTPRETWMRQIESNMRGEPFRDFHYSLRRSNGTIAYFCVNGIPIHSETGELVGFRGTTRDRTTEIEALQTLNHQVLHDTLTGLPNRRYLLNSLDGGTASPEARVAVLLLDLDGFKTINDVHGHGVGDQLLRLVAGRLSEITRSVDFSCRLGGDEFVIVLFGMGADDAVFVAQRVIDALTAPFLIEARSIRIGVSIGIALAPDQGPVSSLLLRLADQALYEIKRLGGSGVRLYREPATADLVVATPMGLVHGPVVQELRDLASLPGELENALAQNELSLAFQPIRNCADGSITAVEALLRWNNPRRGVVAPDIFVPIAEENGLIVPIGVWVLRQACRLAAETGGSWRIAVNLSPVQFRQPDLALVIGRILRETGLPPERLILELTEQILVSRFPIATDTLRKLRAMGIALALDDFGAGFSNIAYLRDFRFDLLKIDRSVLGIADGQREQVLEGLLTIARAFGMTTVVEGVELLEDWNMLRRLGSVYAQGFLLGRPQSDLASSLAAAVGERLNA